jgi:hypothetical protein
VGTVTNPWIPSKTENFLNIRENINFSRNILCPELTYYSVDGQQRTYDPDKISALSNAFSSPVQLA